MLKVIEEGIEEKIGDERRYHKRSERDWINKYSDLEEKLKKVESLKEELEESYKKLEDAHKKTVETYTRRLTGISNQQDLAEELLNQKAKFEKMLFEQKKNSEMEYNELQAEKFETEVRKKELQKKLDAKDKEIAQFKEKYSNLSERLQDREEQLQEKEWLLVEIRQEFEEKFLELQNNHAKERDELMSMMRTKRAEVFSLCLLLIIFV